MTTAAATAVAAAASSSLGSNRVEERTDVDQRIGAHDVQSRNVHGNQLPMINSGGGMSSGSSGGAGVGAGASGAAGAGSSMHPNKTFQYLSIGHFPCVSGMYSNEKC